MTVRDDRPDATPADELPRQPARASDDVRPEAGDAGVPTDEAPAADLAVEDPREGQPEPEPATAERVEEPVTVLDDQAVADDEPVTVLDDEPVADDEPAASLGDGSLADDAPTSDDAPVADDEAAADDQPAPDRTFAADPPGDRPRPDQGAAADDDPANDRPPADQASSGDGRAADAEPAPGPSRTLETPASPAPSAAAATETPAVAATATPTAASTETPAVAATGAPAAAATETPSAAPAATETPTAWRALARGARPRFTRAQLLAGLLCAVLGFALVVQVRQNRTEGLSTLSQPELVRILDEATQRTNELEREAAALERTRQELENGTDTQAAALQAATDRAEVLGILSGRLPAEGPGVEILITEADGRISALTMLDVLEELRNAGAEAVQLNSLRLTASSYFLGAEDGIVVDGTAIQPPYRWVAIGDPDTLAPALNIQGGAMAAVRNSGGRGTITPREHVAVTATRVPPEPKYAKPADDAK